MNEKEINGSKIMIHKFIPSSKREKPTNSNLYIKNFPEKWTEEEILKYIDTEFGKYGEIISKGTFKDTKIERFYSFVAFKEEEHADQAVKELHDKVFEGEELPFYVVKFLSKQRRKDEKLQRKLQKKNDTNLYVRNLKKDIDEDQFKNVFEKYGEVTSVCVKEWKPKKNIHQMQPTEQRILKFGFVNFKNAEDAQKCFKNYGDDLELKGFFDSEK